jgi:hypothetical protein
MAAVAGNSRSKMRDLDRHGEYSTQPPEASGAAHTCTVIDGQSDVQRGQSGWDDAGTQFCVITVVLTVI